MGLSLFIFIFYFYFIFGRCATTPPLAYNAAFFFLVTRLATSFSALLFLQAWVGILHLLGFPDALLLNILEGQPFNKGVRS